MWLLVSLLPVFGQCDPIDDRTRSEFSTREFAECSFEAPRRRRSADEGDFFRIRFWRVDPLLGNNITFTEVLGDGESDIIRPVDTAELRIINRLYEPSSQHYLVCYELAKPTTELIKNHLNVCLQCCFQSDSAASEIVNTTFSHHAALVEHVASLTGPQCDVVPVVQSTADPTFLIVIVSCTVSAAVLLCISVILCIHCCRKKKTVTKSTLPPTSNENMIVRSNSFHPGRRVE